MIRFSFDRFAVAVCFAALSAFSAPVAAYAGYCGAGAPYVYVWGQDGSGDYYYTGVFEADPSDGVADLVAVFAEKARSQYGAAPASKPSRCVSSYSEAEADRDSRMSRQSGADQHEIDR